MLSRLVHLSFGFVVSRHHLPPHTPKYEKPKVLTSTGFTIYDVRSGELVLQMEQVLDAATQHTTSKITSIDHYDLVYHLRLASIEVLVLRLCQRFVELDIITLRSD